MRGPTVDLTAGADGAVADSFTLPSSFAAGFTVNATEATTGASATVTFSSAFATPAGPPTLVSDQPDYSPGNTVTLTGTNWRPGELVHISVNDDQGKIWSYNADVIATVTGTIYHQFQLPLTFVATYTATATGPLSGMATATFTDGNVKFDTSIPAQVVETLYASATDCTGAIKNGYPKTDTDGSDTVGAGSSESIRLDAAANANAPNASQAFSAWSSTDAPASPFTMISGTGGKSICIPGFQSGTRNYLATYAAANQAPSVTRNNATVTVNEGQTAANSGTYTDANGGDNVTISASVGTVTKTGTNTGTWSWSFVTTDGPAQSQTVTITANDGNGGIATTTFALIVNNVAPTATFNAPLRSTRASPSTSR